MLSSWNNIFEFPYLFAQNKICILINLSLIKYHRLSFFKHYIKHLTIISNDSMHLVPWSAKSISYSNNLFSSFITISIPLGRSTSRRSTAGAVNYRESDMVAYSSRGHLGFPAAHVEKEPETHDPSDRTKMKTIHYSKDFQVIFL